MKMEQTEFLKGGWVRRDGWPMGARVKLGCAGGYRAVPELWIHWCNAYEVNTIENLDLFAIMREEYTHDDWENYEQPKEQ